MKASMDAAVSTGWWAECFARTKRMKSLADYLRTPEQRREEGARNVMSLFRRFKGGTNGSR